jgi:hypothetical protein
VINRVSVGGIDQSALPAMITRDESVIGVPRQLILKRASASRPSGQWSDEDYDVLADGKVVGRIYDDGSAGTPPELRWFWSVTAIWPATPGVTSGTAATREEAMARFRAAWEKAKP